MNTFKVLILLCLTSSINVFALENGISTIVAIGGEEVDLFPSVFTIRVNVIERSKAAHATAVVIGNNPLTILTAGHVAALAEDDSSIQILINEDGASNSREAYDVRSRKIVMDSAFRDLVRRDFTGDRQRDIFSNESMSKNLAVIVFETSMSFRLPVAGIEESPVRRDDFLYLVANGKKEKIDDVSWNYKLMTYYTVGDVENGLIGARERDGQLDRGRSAVTAGDAGGGVFNFGQNLVGIYVGKMKLGRRVKDPSFVTLNSSESRWLLERAQSEEGASINYIN
jgi:hypothetical protein